MPSPARPTSSASASGASRRNGARSFTTRISASSKVQFDVSGLRHILFAALAGIFFSARAADPYPSKPVRIVVAAGAGTVDDVGARIVAEKVSTILGQQFFIENRPGAGGAIGQTFVMKSPPDGYTLLLAGGSMAGARFANAAVTYDVLRDFTPISLVETSPFVLIVHASVPARNLKEYITLARSRPGKMTYASIGAGPIPYWS